MDYTVHVTRSWTQLSDFHLVIMFLQKNPVKCKQCHVWKWKWSHSVMSDSVTAWTVAYQASPSMGFSKQEYWSELPFPSPGDLPDPGIKPRSLVLQADTWPSEPQGKPRSCMASESESEVAQSCPTLCDTMDCSLAGFSLHGILQARVLEWVAISFSRGSSRPRDWTQVSWIPGRRFNLWATREVQWFEVKSVCSTWKAWNQCSLAGI